MKSPLLQSLFDEEETRPLTVSELNEQVKNALERNFASVWIEGEIVNFVAANSGHWYFTLHDADSQLKAACYVRNNLRIRFQPFDGLQVRVRGKLSVYHPKGEYQILVESLQPVGEGALKVAFEQIKTKLAREGLFDEEKLANQQNENTGEKIDVLIVGRGGGSSEDLWAFNEERVARAIRNSAIPVISAVGHEIDFTIADFVADRRAPTPSAAAEIVAESEDSIAAFLSQRRQDLFQLIGYRLLHLRSDWQELALSPVFSEFPQQIKDWHYEIEDFQEQMRDALSEKLKINEQRLETLTNRISPLKLASKLNEKKTRLALLRQKQISTIKDIVDAKDEKLKISMASLDALSPLSVLKRGFSIVETEAGEILRDARQANVKDKLKIRLANGKLEAKVLSSE
ncbi:MAG: exodeoxyribonuclease VII large subunit [Acidobacteria bacterium]|nr:exodeoxyribonuclease VII large subunit [Acidobacteriota bacterium]